MTKHTTTLYGDVSETLLNAMTDIRLLVLDVDGVFSDGRIYLGNNGEELKAFHTRDGYGIKAVVKHGVEVAIITGRRSRIVEERMKALNVEHIIQGQEDKHRALTKLAQRLGLKAKHIMSVGDDMPDLGMFSLSGIRVAVKDAHPYVKQQADLITTQPGGFGAVREVCDHLLLAKGKLQYIHGASV
ncbi:3-deoxy-manno-octulosonate-8-phosphatase KdsC [Aestuariibacter salexigens]|uniref:3-deoxy-manno-octulosonate-8-phosphatase KdsC n=1 Tax=Aestuariibacter salexigens TaxID=226010 RepID=UPI000417B1E4|nr:3-deoxy-manno-octulosonate-8-phosphatase KdsC [Aestuariibacter salexigens]